MSFEDFEGTTFFDFQDDTPEPFMGEDYNIWEENQVAEDMRLEEEALAREYMEELPPEDTILEDTAREEFYNENMRDWD